MLDYLITQQVAPNLFPLKVPLCSQRLHSSMALSSHGHPVTVTGLEADVTQTDFH